MNELIAATLFIFGLALANVYYIVRFPIDALFGWGWGWGWCDDYYFSLAHIKKYLLFSKINKKIMIQIKNPKSLILSQLQKYQQ